MSITVLGTAGNYYIGADVGSGVLWKHNASGAGDIDILSAAGESFLDIVYDSYSVSGPFTVFATKTLASGFTLKTTLEDKGNGVYKVSHELTSTSNRWLKLQKSLQGTATGTSNVEQYNNTATAAADLSAFHAAALHHSSGAAVGIIAGNGFDNDYCIYDWAYTANTNWYNGNVIIKTADEIRLTYGLLKNYSTTDYTVQVKAGVPKTLSYVLCTLTPTTQATLNAALYDAYHDVYSTAARTNSIEKMLWATGHQLQRIKRHILVEGAKVLVSAPVNKGYSGMISAGDMIYTMLGVGDRVMVAEILKTLHTCGAPPPAAGASSVMGAPDSVMDSSYSMFIPFVELYAKTQLGYSPDATARDMYLQIADSYAATINGRMMIPAAATRLAHFYSNVFGGTEGLGFGDFSEPFEFYQGSNLIYRWSEEIAGSASTARVGTDGGVTPHSGSHQCKLESTDASSYARRRMMPLAVPSAKSLTVSAFVDVTAGALPDGFRFHIVEMDSNSSVINTILSPMVSATTGYQQTTFTFTTSAATCFASIVIEALGTTTTYVDDVQCRVDTPDYPGLFWSICAMPPQILGHSLTPGAFATVWAQLNMRSLKSLVGASWTADHEAALQALDATYPAAYWTNSGHTQIREDVYHPIRKNWQTSFALFGHFMWFVMSGSKIFTDTEVANLYTNFPKNTAGGPYGAIAFKGWLMNLDGSALGSEADWMTGWPTTAGYYVNGGCWLWASDAFFYRSAIWAGVTGAEAQLQNRLLLEVYHSYCSHESMTDDGTAKGFASLDGYGSNALILLGGNTTPIIPPTPPIFSTDVTAHLPLNYCPGGPVRMRIGRKTYTIGTGGTGPVRIVTSRGVLVLV